MDTQKIIYDFGSNNGDDLPYYLKKADRVVAIEANPVLCREIALRFSGEIEADRLRIENCVVTTGDSDSEVYFYIHKHNHVLSQFPEPADVRDFEKVRLPAKSVMDIVKAHGAPHYIKIDIEHYDEMILRTLFEHGVRPPFISAESHSVDVFCLLVSLGNYKAFKLVDGASVSRLYKSQPISVGHGKEEYSFPHHSAGPYGEDIHGEWMGADNFFKLLALERLGWKDVHATDLYAPNTTIVPRLARYARIEMTERAIDSLRMAFPAPVKRLVRQTLSMVRSRPRWLRRAG